MASKGSGIRVVIFDEYDKIHRTIRTQMVEAIESFTHLSPCTSFVEQNSRDNRATVIVTTSTNERTLQAFDNLDPVEAILISTAKQRDINKLPYKVIGIYNKMDDLINALHETMDLLEYELNGNSVLFHRNTDGTDNANFYFYDLWKNYNHNEILPKSVLIDQARLLFHSEHNAKPSIRDFNKEYKEEDVLKWLNKYEHPFPYYLLVTNALRTHDQQILSWVRFFLNDLNKQMKPASIGPSYNQVFFGTKLPIAIVDRFEHRTSQDIVSFQCFLPVTRSRADALNTATRLTRRRKLANVLFKIDATNALFIHLPNVTLLDMATPFHVTSVARSTGSGGVQRFVTIVTLVALHKKQREQLLGQFIQEQRRQGKSINDYIYQTIPLIRPDNDFPRNKFHVGQHSIPLYVVQLSQPERDPLAVCQEEFEADELIEKRNWAQAVDALARIKDPNVRVLNKQGCLLRERLQDLPGALDCHEEALTKATDRGKAETLIYLGLVYHDMKNYTESLTCYTQALEWFDKQRPRDAAMVARCLVGLGNTYWALGDLDEALDCSERALALRENEVKPRNEFDIAASLGNIGNILHDKGDRQRGLDYAKRAVDILRTCGRGEPRLAAALNNLGAMYQTSGDNAKARQYFEEALECLPDDSHPHRRSTMRNIEKLNQLEKTN